MPRRVGEQIVKRAPLLAESEEVGPAVRRIVESELPALPVVDADGKLTGIFGEREFIGAIFPGYLGELSYAGFVSEKVEETLEKRATCIAEPVSKYMNTEHIEVGGDWSDAQLAETFLHHRVLIIPIVEDGEVAGVVTRWDFFKALVEGAQNASSGS
jgi:CBS domain-containing protein